MQEENSRCNICPEAVRRTLATMLDMSLLRSPSFMLLAVSGFLCMMGFFVPFMFLARRNEHDMGKDLAGLLVSSIGVANTIARILCGYLSSLESVDANLLSNVAITLGGVATFASGYWINSFTQFGYTVVFGFAIGEFIYIQKLCAFLIEMFCVFFRNFSLLFGLTFDHSS